MYVLLTALLAGCAADPKDTGSASLDTGRPAPFDTYLPRFDTADTGGPGEPPAHTLTITHTGFWDLTPAGGPWTTLTGELRVSEVLDGDEENPTCQATFSLAGNAPSEHDCGECDAVFAIWLSLSDGDPEPCQDPDVPADQRRLMQGWSRLNAAIYYDYLDLGEWLRWYDAAELEDRVEFEWTATFGVAVDEEGA